MRTIDAAQANSQAGIGRSCLATSACANGRKLNGLTESSAMPMWEAATIIGNWPACAALKESTESDSIVSEIP